MTLERLEARIDPEQKRKLREIAEARGLPVSEAVRRMIDEVYEDRARRKAAIERMASRSHWVPEDPEELSRILDAALDPGPLY